ncbi:MAG: hypothetical protein LBC62_11060 [Treponema sp.]|jgi:hypothetical protein|nr:hypothetical protein [Treponema sp.]
MNYNRPLRGALFFYESFRLLLLAVLFAFFSPLEGVEKGAVFPYLAYVSPNALFPLMTLFLWLSLGEYRRYLPLYLAGKLIALAAFYAWGVFSFAPALGAENFGTRDVMSIIVLLSGVFFLSLGDVFSIFGGWLLLNKIKTAETSKPDLAVPGSGENGGM